MTSEDSLGTLLKNIKDSKGINRQGTFQKYIEQKRTKIGLTDEYVLVDPLESKNMVVPKVIPAGVRSPSVRGTPAKIEPIRERLSLEDLGITERDLSGARANPADRKGSKTATKTELLRVAKAINDHEKEQGRKKYFANITSKKREELLDLLREYFDLEPLNLSKEESSTKKSSKKAK